MSLLEGAQQHQIDHGSPQTRQRSVLFTELTGRTEMIQRFGPAQLCEVADGVRPVSC
jgi:hypothetical protein